MNKEQLLIETMFKYSDMGIDTHVLTEAAGVQTSVLIEASEDASGLFSRLNDGRKELMKSVQNIDWKEWVKKMKETVAKIIRFITAPARTAKDLVTGKTTLKEVGQRLKQVWANLRAKKDKTPEEKVAEKAVGEMATEIAKVEEKVDAVSDTTERETERKQKVSDTTDRETERGKEIKEALDTNKEIDRLYRNAQSSYHTASVIVKRISAKTDSLSQELIIVVKDRFSEFSDSSAFDNLDEDHVSLYIRMIKRLSGNGERGIEFITKTMDNVTDVYENDTMTAQAKANSLKNLESKLSKYADYLREINDRLMDWVKDGLVNASKAADSHNAKKVQVTIDETDKKLKDADKKVISNKRLLQEDAVNQLTSSINNTIRNSKNHLSTIAKSIRDIEDMDYFKKSYNAFKNSEPFFDLDDEHIKLYKLIMKNMDISGVTALLTEYDNRVGNIVSSINYDDDESVSYNTNNLRAIANTIFIYPRYLAHINSKIKLFSSEY